jgi:hypothetical protein
MARMLHVLHDDSLDLAKGTVAGLLTLVYSKTCGQLLYRISVKDLRIHPFNPAPEFRRYDHR